MNKRVVVILRSWPDPIIQERLEDMGFFQDKQYRTWIYFCDLDEVKERAVWLKEQHVSFEVREAKGVGQRKKYACLSESLLLKDGGGASACAVCGARDVPCRQWIEGDDTDSVEYPGAPRFYMCGTCVRERMHGHPRLYAPAPDRL